MSRTPEEQNNINKNADAIVKAMNEETIRELYGDSVWEAITEEDPAAQEEESIEKADPITPVQQAQIKPLRLVLAIVVGIASCFCLVTILKPLELYNGEGLVPVIYALIVFGIPAVLAVIVSGWKPNPSNSAKAASAPATTQKAAFPKTKQGEYILVPKSMVMHRKSCRYAQNLYTMNHSYTDNRKAAISVGYRPCKHCKP